MAWLDVVRVPDVVVLISTEGCHELSCTAGVWGAVGGDGEVITTVHDGSLRVEFVGTHKPVSRIELTWNADSPAGLRLLGDHWERGYGDLEWRGIVPGRRLPWYFVWNCGDVSGGCGVMTGAGSIAAWRVTGSTIHLELDIRSGGQGVRTAGRVVNAATVVSLPETSASAFQAAHALCRRLCSKPLMPANPVYGLNNWYYAYGESSYDLVLRDADMASQLSSNGANRPFMVIDEGWQFGHKPHDVPSGPWHIGNAKFPDMSRLAEGIVRAGAKPGIWIRPLYTSESVPESLCFPVSRHPGLFAHPVLDPSVPESLERIAQDFRRLVQWGYQLIKHDFTTYDIFGQWGYSMTNQMGLDGWGFRDQSRTSSEIILDLYRTIRTASGDATIIACNTVGHLAAGLVEVQRTGDDTSGREWERTRKMGVNTMAMRLPQHGAFYACDADCVGLTEYVPWRLNRQWLELLANSSTPLFVSPDPHSLSDDRKAAIREAFDLASRPMPIAEPLDWMDTTCPQTWQFGQKIKRFNWNQAPGDTAG